MRYIKNMLAVLMVSLCLAFAAAPAQTVYAASAGQTEVQTEAAGEDESAEDQDQSAFFLIMMGGALLVILVAVISAVATVSSSIAVAANMDVDGE